MPNNKTGDDLMAQVETLLSSPEFSNLWSSMSEHYISWDRFSRLAMPKGMSPELAWRLIAGLRKGAGTTFEYPPWFPFDAQGEIWFNATAEGDACLRDIVVQTAGGSKVVQSISKLDGYYFSYYLMLDEFLLACSNDGFLLDSNTVRRIAFYGEDPQTDGERLFSNLLTVFSGSYKLYGDRSITHGLVEDVYRALSEGLKEDIPRATPCKMSDSSYYTPERVLDLVCKLARCEGANRTLHPVLAYIEIARMFWDLCPLDGLNFCVEVVLRKLFFAEYGFQGCAYLEMLTAEKRLRTSTGDMFGFEMTQQGYPQEYQLFGLDGTFYHEVLLREYVDELSRLSMKIDRFVVKRSRQKRRVKALPDLNSRECDVLLNLLRNPQRIATIEIHQQRHHIAYATAHDDLAHLCDLGYLCAGKQGRKLVYTVGDMLVQLA